MDTFEPAGPALGERVRLNVSPPLPAGGEWALAWAGALLAALVLLRLPYVGKLVR